MGQEIMSQKEARRNVYGGMPIEKKLENVVYKEYQLGKMILITFFIKEYSMQNLIDLVLIDLCGPIGLDNYHGDKLFILFCDDYSRLMPVMFLKEKSEAFDMLRKYKVRVEKETRRTLKLLEIYVIG